MTAVLPARRPGAATELPPETDTQDEVLAENFHPTTGTTPMDEED
jgi:hypothetical protein